MLEERDLAFRYRDYCEEPLDLQALRALFKKLDLSPRVLLRPREAAALELTGEESDETLLQMMAREPTLLQRPIGVLGQRAVLGRPPENLLQLVD